MIFSTTVYLKNCFDDPAMFLSLSPTILIFYETFVSSSEIFTANTPVAAIQNDEQIITEA